MDEMDTFNMHSTGDAWDCVQEMGVVVDIGPQSVARCVEEAGVGFMFAPRRASIYHSHTFVFGKLSGRSSAQHSVCSRHGSTLKIKHANPHKS